MLSSLSESLFLQFVTQAVPDWFYKNKYPSVERIALVRQPTLFLSGRSDDLVPPSHMDRLHEVRQDEQLFNRLP